MAGTRYFAVGNRIAPLPKSNSFISLVINLKKDSPWPMLSWPFDFSVSE